MAVDPVLATPKESTDSIRAGYATWRDVINAAGLAVGQGRLILQGEQNGSQ